MKKQPIYTIAMMLSIALLIGLNSCKKDTTSSTIKLESLKAGDIDLNGLFSANNVPANPTIEATFPLEIDPLTVTTENVKIVRDYDAAIVEVTYTVSGKTITMVPKENLATGAMHKVIFGTGLKFVDGSDMTVEVLRTFSTDGFFAPTGMVAYWNFDNNANDNVGTFNPSAEIDMTYIASRKTSAGKAASFNGTTSIIEIPNGDQLMKTHDFTLSFWIKAGHGHFVIGLGAFFGFQFELDGNFKWFKMPVQFEYADGTTGTGGDPTYNGDGKTKDNGGYMGTVFCKQDAAIDASMKDKWAHVVYIYNSTTKQRMFFLNGELVFKQDHNLWPAIDKQRTVVGLKYNGTEPDVYNDLALGFIQSRRGKMWASEAWGGYTKPGANHFKGELDDIRIFNKAISDAEVRLIYNSEK
jgi:hypothetical protein